MCLQTSGTAAQSFPKGHDVCRNRLFAGIVCISCCLLLPQVLLLDGAMQELANQLKDIQSMLFFARGRNYATALEAALKVSMSITSPRCSSCAAFFSICQGVL